MAALSLARDLFGAGAGFSSSASSSDSKTGFEVFAQSLADGLCLNASATQLSRLPLLADPLDVLGKVLLHVFGDCRTSQCHQSRQALVLAGGPACFERIVGRGKVQRHTSGGPERGAWPCWSPNPTAAGLCLFPMQSSGNHSQKPVTSLLVRRSDRSQVSSSLETCLVNAAPKLSNLLQGHSG